MSHPESLIIGSATREGSRVRVVMQFTCELPKGHLNVVLTAHDAVASFWCASISPQRNHKHQLTAEFNVDPGWGNLLEVSAIRVIQDNSANTQDYLGGRDFEKTYLALTEDGRIVMGAEAATHVTQIDAARRALYEKPIGSGPHRYRAVLIAEGVLVTQDHRVPGLSLMRVQNSMRGADLETIVNSALTQLKFGSRIAAGSWVQQYRQRKPTLVLSINEIRASTANEAGTAALQAAYRLLTIMSMQRGSAGSLIGGVIEAKSDPAENASWLGVPPYGGNLLGGFISGESPHDIVRRYEAVSTDPRTGLWLTLYRDALSELRWDFRFFRFFNLLETIARQVVGETSSVIDFTGAPLKTQGGSIATTKTARGKVYELLRRWSDAVKVSERSMCVPSSEGALWIEVAVWVGIRDAVAHDGGYRPDSGTRIPLWSGGAGRKILGPSWSAHGVEGSD